MSDTFVEDLLKGHTTPGFGLGSSGSERSYVDELLSPPPVRTPAVIEDAVQVNPDQELERRKQAENAGVAPEGATVAPEAVAARSRVTEIDRLLSDAPVTSRFMGVPDNARISHDDVENLSAWERISRGFQHGVLINERGRAGVALFGSPQSAELRAHAEAIDAELSALGHSSDGWIGFLSGAAEVIGQMTESFGQPGAAALIGGGGALGAATGAAGGPLAPVTATAGALAGMAAGAISFRGKDAFQLEAGNSYLDQVKAGVDPQVAKWTSLGVGVINAGLELASDALMLKPLTSAAKVILRRNVREAAQSKVVREMAQDFAIAYGTAVGSEVGTEVLQEMTAMAGEEIGKAFSEGDFESLTSAEVLERVTDIMIKTFKGSALLMGMGPSAQLGADIVVARDAAKARETLEKLHAQAEASKLVERAPDKAAEHGAETLIQAGVENVYIPAEKLVEYAQRTGNADVLYEALGVSAEIEQAYIRGGDVKVSAEGLTRGVLQSEHFDGLADHVRMTPDAMTAEEAKEFKTSGLSDALTKVEEAVEVSKTSESAKTESGVLTDDSGRPLVVYHGSRADNVEVFDATDGVYFTPDRGEATTFPDMAGLDTEGRVYPAHVTLKNPLEVEAPATGPDTPVSFMTPKRREELQRQGHDGAIARRPDGSIAEVVVFNAAQIRMLPREKDGSPSRGAPPTAETLAEDELGLGAMFKSAKDAGMTDKQYESYLAAVAKAAEAPRLAREERELKQQQRELSDEWKALQAKEREAAQEALSNEPVFQALNAVGAERLDRAAVVEILGSEKAIADLPTQKGGRQIVAGAKEEGVDPQAFAELYGFADADEMFLAMMERGSFSAAVEAQTARAMRQKHTAVLTRADEVKAAIAALHNDQTQAVLLEELNALREARKEGRLSPKLVTQAARDEMQDHKIADIETNVYQSAAKRAARAAGKFLRGGKRVDAARAKFQQVINFTMSQEAYRVKAELQKKTKYLSKFRKPPKKGNTLPVEYQRAINHVLSGVNLGRRMTARAESWQRMLADFVQREAAKGNIVRGIASREARRASTRLEENARTPTTETTLAEFREMYDTVRALEKAGRSVDKMNREAEKQTRQEIVDTLVAEVQANLPQRQNLSPRKGTLEGLKHYTRQYVSLVLNADTVLRAIDGFKDLGPAYMAIKGRIDQAYYDGYHPGQVGLVRRARKEGAAIVALYNKHFTPKERREFTKLVKIPGVTRSMTRGEMLAAMGNMGNEDNIQALMDSGQFTRAELDAIRDFASQKEWDFIQAAWDYMGNFWPEVKATVERRTNTTPVQVAPREFTTPHGTYAGGYWPLRYDSFQAVLQNPEQTNEMIQDARYGGFSSSHTRDGHTQHRKGSGKRPVLLDLFVLNSHVDQVIYDLEIGDAVVDAYRVLHHPDFKRAMAEQGHLEKWNGLDLWLGDVVVGEMHAGDVINATARRLRTGYTISKLAWNFTTAALQPLGVAQTAAQIGKRDTLQGLLMFMRSPWFGEGNVFDEVAAQSVFMSQREESFNRDIVDAKRVIAQSGNRYLQAVEGSFFFFIRKAQRFVDVVTWLAAERQGLRKFDNDTNRARLYADRMVARTQASGNFHERTAFERGTINNKTRQSELVRMWTVFSSYFLAKTNITYEQVKKTNFRDPVAAMDVMVNLALIYTVETVLADLIRGYGPEDDADAGDWAQYLGTASISTALQGLIGIREFTQEAQGFRGGAMIGSLSRDAARAIEQVSQAEWDASLVKSLNNLAGPMVPYPSAQMNKTGEAFHRWLIGEDINVLHLFRGPPRD